MKIIVGLTFLGVIASMNLVAANRGKKNKAAEAAEVEEQVEVKEDTSKRNIKKIRKDNSEGTQSMPTPEALQEISSGGASSNSSSSAISWCSKKISMEDIQAFLEGFEAKQQELLLVMEAQGFSPLAAAAFLALDDENFTCLLEGVKKRDLNIKSMLTSRACVKITADGKDILNSANLMKLLFSARQLSPIVSGIIGRTPESLAKWFARRITMWKDALKVTGTHF
ncbi:hypothetical protein FJ364_02280, partial [Candidatus Dependentiae bacterium]|nr:hypothetical protein [Candidatus Dependentiae bacterium]